MLTAAPIETHKARFTRDGNDALEQHLAQTCQRVRARVCSVIGPARLDAIVLGGGYGRGQGGVLANGDGDAPYNDLEFYVFTRGNRLLAARRYQRELDWLGEEISSEARVHVEFKIDSLARFRRSAVTMFSYDLVSGHKIVFGDSDCFAGCEHHLDARKIPHSEAIRLLFNRCTGLLLAKDLLREPVLTDDDADFIERNIAKARLALGDAALAAFGQYHWDCLERERRLNELASAAEIQRAEEIVAHHKAGVQFKLRPHRSENTRAVLGHEHNAVSEVARDIWLWLEGRRLNCPLASVRDYAFSPTRKSSESSAARNLLLTVTRLGPRAGFSRRVFRYPRERLFNSLCLLLWGDSHDASLRRFLQLELCTSATDWSGLLEAYKRIWKHFG